MLVLTEVTDKISLITDVACDVDVVATYTELDESSLVVGVLANQKTNITTATTTDIVGVPGNSTTTRNVRELSIRNAHASTCVDVTVQFNANGALYELHAERLYSGEVLFWTLGDGFTALKRREKLHNCFVSSKNGGQQFNINDGSSGHGHVPDCSWSHVFDTRLEDFAVNDKIVLGFFSWHGFSSNLTTTGASMGVLVEHNGTLTFQVGSAMGAGVNSVTAATMNEGTSTSMIPTLGSAIVTNGDTSRFFAGGFKAGTFSPLPVKVHATLVADTEVAGAAINTTQGSWFESFEPTN